MWQIDVEQWEKEQAKMLADVESALSAELSGIQEHARSIAQHQQRVRQHELFIGDLERSGRDNPTEIEARLAEDHVNESKNHSQVRKAHERLKRYHHRAMARLAVVLRSLDQEA